MQMLGTVAALDPPPPYRNKWNLAGDINFKAGVIYMAQMNPKEPACLEMTGVAAWKKHDYHLAVVAFEKAIALGSPQTDLLKLKIAGLKDYIRQSTVLGGLVDSPIAFVLIFILIPALVIYYFYARRRDRRRKLNP